MFAENTKIVSFHWAEVLSNEINYTATPSSEEISNQRHFERKIYQGLTRDSFSASFWDFKLTSLGICIGDFSQDSFRVILRIIYRDSIIQG